MGRQCRVRYKLAWPGLCSLPIYIIGVGDVVYSAENRLPSSEYHLNTIENQYVKLSHVMALLPEHEHYHCSSLLNKLIVEFNLRGLRTIALLSANSVIQQVIVDQYLPLTTLLPFLLVYPSSAFIRIFQRLLNFLDSYLDTICFSCGFIVRNCACVDNPSVTDDEESVGYSVCYCDKEVQTSDTEPFNPTPDVNPPPPPLQCMEEMSKTPLSNGLLQIPTSSSKVSSSSVGMAMPENVSKDAGMTGQTGMGEVSVKLPADLKLPPGIRLPVTIVQNTERPCLISDMTSQSYGFPPAPSLPNITGPMMCMGGMNMMNYGNSQFMPGLPLRPGFPSLGVQPYFQHGNMPPPPPEPPFFPMMPPVTMPAQSQPGPLPSTPIMAYYSSTAYEPSSNPLKMGEPHGQVTVMLPKHVNPKYINTSLGTFKRMSGTRNIGIQVLTTLPKKKGAVCSELGAKKLAVKVKLGKYQKRGIKKDAVSRAIDKIKKIKMKSDAPDTKMTASIVKVQEAQSVIDDCKMKAGSKKADKVWRMIVDDEESEEDRNAEEAGSEKSEKELLQKIIQPDEDVELNNDKVCNFEKAEDRFGALENSQDAILALDTVQSDLNLDEQSKTDASPSDTETVGAEDQTKNVAGLDVEDGPLNEMTGAGNLEFATKVGQTDDGSIQGTGETNEVRKHELSEGELTAHVSSNAALSPEDSNMVESMQLLESTERIASNAMACLSGSSMNQEAKTGLPPEKTAKDCNSGVHPVEVTTPVVCDLTPLEEIQKRTLAAEVLGSLATAGEIEQKLPVVCSDLSEQVIENGTAQASAGVKEEDGGLSVHSQSTGNDNSNDKPVASTENGSRICFEESENSGLIIDEGMQADVESQEKACEKQDVKNIFEIFIDDLPRNPNIDHEKKYFAKFEHLPTGEKLFKCIYPRCLQCFDTRAAAKLHNQCHSKSESVRHLLCLQCEYKTPFFRWFDLLRHLRETHKVGLTDHPNGCLFCGLEFDTQERLARHLEFHYSSRYKCVHCGLMMMSWGQVEQHVDSCPEKNQVKVNFGCPYCMFVFHKKTIRNLHMLSHSDTGLTCALCEDTDVQWQHWKLLRKHYQTRHSKALMAKIGPFRHLLPMKKRSPKCHACGLEFKSFDLYSIHVIKVHDLVPFTLLPCKLCEKSFRTKRRLDYHVKNAHDEETACRECDYIAKNKTFLKLHMSQKHTEKQHVCTECGKSFMYYHQLRVHMAHHARKIVHTCRQCNQEFTRSAELRKHMADQHAAPMQRKTYNCSQCDYWTYAKSTLAYHVEKKHTKHNLGNDLESIPSGGHKDVSKESDGHTYINSYVPGERKRKLPQAPTTGPRAGRRKKRKRLTMPTRRVSVSRSPTVSEAMATSTLKRWITEKPVRNRDERKRIRLEEMEQKRLKKMRKCSCARTRSVEEQKAIRFDSELDLFDAPRLEVSKSHMMTYRKKYCKSIGRDESLIVNLSYPYIDHNYYQLETQAEFSTYKSTNKLVGRRYHSGGKLGLPDFMKGSVSMNVVSTPKVSGFEECETSPGEGGGRGKVRDHRYDVGRSSKHCSPRQFSPVADWPASSTPLHGANGPLQSPGQVRSLLSGTLHSSPMSASHGSTSGVSQLKSTAVESPSLEDFSELIGESGEILPEQDLGLITDILNSIDTSGMNTSGKTGNSTASSQDLSVPLDGHCLGKEPGQTPFPNGTDGRFSDEFRDDRSLRSASPAHTAVKRVTGGGMPKPSASGQNSGGRSFDDGILNTTRADLTNELATDIDEIELKEADYQLWHGCPQPSGQHHGGQLGNSLAEAEVTVEPKDSPVKAATEVTPPGGDCVNQPLAWLMDHQYC